MYLFLSNQFRISNPEPNFHIFCSVLDILLLISSDNYMLTRLAFLSDFGETEYRENASGIWQLTRENWEKARTVVSGTNLAQVSVVSSNMPN